MTILKKILLLSCISLSLETVFITPTYPPTAFQNQYYSVVFRIRGADFPVFIFSGLPTGISGSTDGTVSGIPSVAGSFSVKLTYLVSGETGSRQFILIVTPDNFKRSTDSVISVKNSKNLIIVFPESFLFRVQEKVAMKFNVQSGQ